MDISKIADSPGNISNRQLPPADLFRQITQLGSIEAKVALINKGQALLNSQLGQILSNNSLDLKAGDRLNLRASGSEQNPVLKITRLPALPITLSATINQTLNQALANDKSAVALVINQNSGKTIIQLGKQRISVQTPIELKQGQLISLMKSSKNHRIELQPVNHQQVLKSALGQLLTLQSNPQQPAALTHLARLLQTILVTQTVRSDGDNQTLQTKQNSSLPPQASPAATQLTGQQGQSSKSMNLFSQLSALLNALPQLAKLDKSTIQQWVRFIVATGQNRDAGPQMTANPYQLLKQMPKSETAFIQQLLQLRLPTAQTLQASTAEADVKPDLDGPLLAMGKEIGKLVEQSLGQQLLQQTNLRLQQEQQLPIALNLTIPLTDQQKIQELRLKIRQRNREADAENQSWDIQLDFEFGLLGLISTHLLLDGNRLSASFWSDQAETQQKIDSNLSVFKQQLTRAGYDLGEFHSFAGKPPQESSRDTMALPESLLDIKV